MKALFVNEPKVYSYNGHDITFFNDLDSDVMINATEMAKTFGKTPKDYLRTQPAKELVEAVAKRHICLLTDIVKVVNGGEGRGTWMHETVALDFAQWLSVDFKLWCTDRIKEFITNGSAVLRNISRKELAKMLYDSELEKEKLAAIYVLQEKEIRKAAPKAEYYDNVLQSESVISVSELANELGFRSAKALNAFLRDKGVIKRVNGTWTMCAKYSGLNYAQYKTYAYFDSEGRRKTSQHLYFTNKGRQFLQNFSLNK